MVQDTVDVVGVQQAVCHQGRKFVKTFNAAAKKNGKGVLYHTSHRTGVFSSKPFFFFFCKAQESIKEEIERQYAVASEGATLPANK